MANIFSEETEFFFVSRHNLSKKHHPQSLTTQTVYFFSYIILDFKLNGVTEMASNYAGEEDDYELIDDDEKDDDEDLARLDDDLVVDEEEDVDVDERTDRVVGTTRWRGRKKLKLGVEEARSRGRGRRVGGGRSSLGAASTTTTSGLATTSSTTVSASQTTTTTTAARPIDQAQVEARRQLAVKIDRVCEYALVLMHCILYKINYYNRKTHFDKSIKYDIVVYVSFK